MRQKPLTDEELDEFLASFGKSFKERYHFLLESGAVPDEYWEKGSYGVAKVALIITSELYNNSRLPSFKSLLSNCKKF